MMENVNVNEVVICARKFVLELNKKNQHGIRAGDHRRAV